MLAGHSHGGQIRLPFFGPLVLPPMAKLYPEGHYHFKQLQLYVNRGLGTVGLPFRLNCPPEITVITLNPTPKHPPPLTNCHPSPQAEDLLSLVAVAVAVALASRYPKALALGLIGKQKNGASAPGVCSR